MIESKSYKPNSHQNNSRELSGHLFNNEDPNFGPCSSLVIRLEPIRRGTSLGLQREGLGRQSWQVPRHP